MSIKRHWFHCTSEWKGDRWTADYRPPIFRAKTEPDTPRLCVCRTIPNCFSAVLFRRADVYAYRTIKKLRGIRPRKVWDELVTRERWIIPPVELEFAEVIPAADVVAIQDAVRIFHMETRGASSVAVRIGQVLRAWEVLGDRFPDKHELEICRLMRERFKIGPKADD